MIHILILMICFSASAAGAICGIGGGIIIKPLLDALGFADAGTISFLSGCTVLSMTSYSMLKSHLTKDNRVQLRISMPLALGAAAGGVLGRWIFLLVQSASEDSEQIGFIQAICLLLMTLGAFVYTVMKHKIDTHHMKSIMATIWIGFILGLVSSFLGIGGGPVNLVVFYFFFSMSTKTAAENSLYVIFFSQTASLIQALLTGNVPEFAPEILIIMIIGGIIGGICGRSINKRIDDKYVEGLFIVLMMVMILVNVYNICRFW